MAYTTTEYGTWCNLVDSMSLTVEQTVLEFLGDFAAEYDVDALANAYRGEINALLPPLVNLCGNDFLGPYDEQDQDFDGYPSTEDGCLDIAAIVDQVDLSALADQHEYDARRYQLAYEPLGQRDVFLLADVRQGQVNHGVRFRQLREMGLIDQYDRRLTVAGECSVEVGQLLDGVTPPLSEAGANVLVFGPTAVPGANRARVLRRLEIAGLWSSDRNRPTDRGADVATVLKEYAQPR